MSAESGKKEKLRRLIIIVPVAIAVIVVGILVRSRKGPERLPLTEQSRTVRVISTRAADVIPRAIGYGYVEPGQVWQVVPEVSGRIAEVSPAFKKGNFAEKGMVLLRIDPAEYRLTVAQTEANIENIRAQLSELTLREQNNKTSLEIERRSLRLKQKNMERNKRALASDSVSEVQYEQTQIDYQNQLARVQDLENALNLIPATRKALQASLALTRAQLDEARLNLERTEITVPFDCRITEISAEIGQFVQKGQIIASADGIGTAEIEAQIPISKMSNLIRAVGGKPLATMRQTLGELNMDKIRELFGLRVKVRLRDGNFEAEWDARFARADATIDSQTRTLGVIVVVDDPYKQVIVGVRPPLVRNMFCEVEISGRPIAQSIVIPRSALHDGHVYVADAENRLKRKKVVVDFPQTDFYVIREGLKAGEQLVVSDLIPAIDGMLLEPSEDQALSEKLMAQATGQTPLK